VAAAVTRLPDVACVYGGPYNEYATRGDYLRLIPGVVVSGGESGDLCLDVHVCAVYRAGLVLPALAQAIRRAAGEALRARGCTSAHIHVHIDDLRVD
jgi:uncharacterized alkaline shock family protein YloU